MYISPPGPGPGLEAVAAGPGISLSEGSPSLIRDFPLYRISLYNGFPFIKDFPAQGTSLDRSGLACPSAGLQSPASGLFIKQQRILEVLNV